LIELFSPFLAEMLLNLDPDSKVLPILANISKGKTAREVRKEVIDITANNLCFGKSVLKENEKSVSGLADNQIITEAATLNRAVLKQQLGWLTWLLLPKAQYKQIEALASMQDDNKFLTRMREQTRMAILKSSVVYTSGPGALRSALFDKLFYKKDTVNEEIIPFSFACYGLEKAFVSENSISLHADAKTVAAKMSNTEVGKSNDLSWLQEGQNATAIREQKIREAQAHMPQDFHDMREKIEAHIKKIQADLEGCFGFYRHRERHAKIHALQSIIGHFEERLFDVSAFHIALNNYRTKDISASIGKSKTKELIDELELFGQRAKHYMLTDEHGRVEILPPTLRRCLVKQTPS